MACNGLFDKRYYMMYLIGEILNIHVYNKSNNSNKDNNKTKMIFKIHPKRMRFQFLCQLQKLRRMKKTFRINKKKK